MLTGQGDFVRFVDSRGRIQAGGYGIDGGAFSQLGAVQIANGVTPDLYKPLWQASIATYSTTAMSAANTVRGFPFWEPRGGTIDRLAYQITTLSAGLNARIALYTNISSTLIYPDRKVYDSGALDTGATGVQLLSLELTLMAQSIYWVVWNTTASPPTVAAITSNDCGMLGYSDTNLQGTRNAISGPLAFGSFPTLFQSAGVINTTGLSPIPMFAVRYAA